jgi:DNA-binding NarL/FixJ family response regulator
VTIRVVLAEDNVLLRAGLEGILSGESDVELVSSEIDLDGLLTSIDAHIPDVVLTDIRMPPQRQSEGIRAAEYCRKTHPDMGVVLLTQFVEPGYVRTLLNQGTQGRGYLLKERVSEPDELGRAIRIVAAGGSVVDPEVVASLVRSKSRRDDPGLGELSAREREVLSEMAQGHTNGAIAASLFITQRAVEKHINSIFSKLGVSQDDAVHPRVRAVLMYLADGAT